MPATDRPRRRGGGRRHGGRWREKLLAGPEGEGACCEAAAQRGLRHGGEALGKCGDDAANGSVARDSASTEASSGPGEAAQRRPREEVEEEVREFLAGSTLSELDFDGRVRQQLHAIFEKGSRGKVHEALEWVADHARNIKVRDGRAYLQSLLKKFLKELTADIGATRSDSSSVPSSDSPTLVAREAPAAHGVDENSSTGMLEAALATKGASMACNSSATAADVAVPAGAHGGGAAHAGGARPQEPAGEEHSALHESSPTSQCMAHHPAWPRVVVGNADPAKTRVAAHTEEMCRLAPHPHITGERFLEGLLQAMYEDMQQIRQFQQKLVTVVEDACREALGKADFRCLKLVGSAAMGIETPGSDVDVVCFTRHCTADAPCKSEASQIQRGHNFKVLQRVNEKLNTQAVKHGIIPRTLTVSIFDARVPLLHIDWGLASGSIAIDLSINQTRSLEHVQWFESISAALEPSATHTAVSTLVTVARCMKLWLRQRQVPKYKEGGMPTVTWLLLAVHAYFCTHDLREGSPSSSRPTAVILARLAAFFHHWAAAGSLNGTLHFQDTWEGGGQKVHPLSSEFIRAQRNDGSPWAKLSVIDPTFLDAKSQKANLAHDLLPATQLLLMHELRRAKDLLPLPPGGGGAQSEGESFARVFDPLRADVNLLPSDAPEGIGALMLIGSPYQGVGEIEVVVIQHIIRRPGWEAPFLHRADTTSELHVSLLNVNEQNGCWNVRGNPSAPLTILCPCHFICRANLGDDPRRHVLDHESLVRFNSMKMYLRELEAPARPGSCGWQHGDGGLEQLPPTVAVGGA